MLQLSYASWLPSQHPAMLRAIEKEGTTIKPPICSKWYDNWRERTTCFGSFLRPCLHSLSSPTLSLSTWAAYNSLIGNLRLLTCAAMFPVINGSPNEWQNLCTAIKEAEKLRQCVWSDGKTVISFDLQLYIKAIRLQQKPDIRDNFVFRMGELHVVFCTLKSVW